MPNRLLRDEGEGLEFDNGFHVPVEHRFEQLLAAIVDLVKINICNTEDRIRQQHEVAFVFLAEGWREVASDEVDHIERRVGSHPDLPIDHGYRIGVAVIGEHHVLFVSEHDAHGLVWNRVAPHFDERVECIDDRGPRNVEIRVAVSG